MTTTAENTCKVYANYGCLAAEKRTIWQDCICSDAYDEAIIELPEGWKLVKGEIEPLVLTPWNICYRINDLLAGNETPCFKAYKDFDINNPVYIQLKYKFI